MPTTWLQRRSRDSSIYLVSITEDMVFSGLWCFHCTIKGMCTYFEFKIDIICWFSDVQSTSQIEASTVQSVASTGMVQEGEPVPVQCAVPRETIR